MVKKDVVRLFAAGLVLALSIVAGWGPKLARADGIGVFPTVVNFDDTLRGGEYFSSLGVINNGNANRTFSFEATGQIADWITFADPADRSKSLQEIVVPPLSDGHVDIRMRVPDTAQNGDYSGEVRALAVQAGGKVEGSGALVNLGAVIEVTAKVSGVQRVDGQFLDLAVTDIEVGYPLRVRSTVKNTGNVRVLPEVHVEITTSATVVGSIDTNDVAVPPDEQRDIESLWNSNVAGPGDYTVRATVEFPGLKVGERTRQIRVVPRGTLTRRGSFESLVLANDVAPGSVARVLATFRNTGQVDALAVFTGEVYRDGKLVSSATSLQRLVRREEVGQLETMIQLPTKGTYTIRGKVNYEGSETETREITFQVGPDGVNPSTTRYVLGGVAFLVVGVAGIAYARRRRPGAGAGKAG